MSEREREGGISKDRGTGPRFCWLCCGGGAACPPGSGSGSNIAEPNPGRVRLVQRSNNTGKLESNRQSAGWTDD